MLRCGSPSHSLCTVGGLHIAGLSPLGARSFPSRGRDKISPDIDTYSLGADGAQCSPRWRTTGGEPTVPLGPLRPQCLHLQKRGERWLPGALGDGRESGSAQAACIDSPITLPHALSSPSAVPDPHVRPRAVLLKGTV